MDTAFYKSLAALGEVGSRKASYRSRVFAGVALFVLLAACMPWFAAGKLPDLGYIKVLAACLVGCVLIAEYLARRRMPVIIAAVAAKHGVSEESLRADAMKHVDAAA